MTNLAVRISPTDWLADWRPERSRLLLPVAVPPRLGDKVAARVQLAGLSAVATVLGKVVSVHRADRDHRVELAPEQESLAAIAMLSAAARGEPLRFVPRPTRYLVKLPVVVPWGGAQVFTNTFCISPGGCAVRWNGPSLRVGQPIQLRVGAGSRSSGVRGVVCWSEGSGSSQRAGVRFLANGTGNDWRLVIDDAVRAGAPPA